MGERNLIEWLGSFPADSEDSDLNSGQWGRMNCTISFQRWGFFFPAGFITIEPTHRNHTFVILPDLDFS